jgi:hypothetical protein
LYLQHIKEESFDIEAENEFMEKRGPQHFGICLGMPVIFLSASRIGKTTGSRGGGGGCGDCGDDETIENWIQCKK